jgi:hypothetical protein
MGTGPFTEFTNRVLIVGGGFAGFTVAKTLGDLTEDRDDVGVMVINKEKLLHLLADGGGDHKQRRGDQERRAAVAAGPDPVRCELPAGGVGERRS